MTRFKLKFSMMVAIASLLFFLKALIQLDPDFGWHIRFGEIISSGDIPPKDPFSYTMSNYPFVGHEWLTSYVLFLFNSSFGYVSLAILFAVLIVPLVWILFKKYSRSTGFLTFGFFFLFLATLLPYFGIRPQVQTWLYLTILLSLLEDKFYKKWYFVIPLLSLWWANVHGSFPILIVVLIVDFIVTSYEQKRVLIKKILVLFTSFVATLITPYFYRSWWEVYMTLSDSALRWRIQEWRPSFMFFSLPFIFFVALYLMALKTYWRNLSRKKIFISLFFFLQAISSTRHVPLWAITATPIVLDSFDIFEKQVSKVKLGKKRLEIAGRVFLIVSALIFVAQACFSLIGARSTSEAVYYPKQAVNFLSQTPVKGRVYSTYDWGGYLIWKYPQKKIYIDGRMPSWRYSSAPPGETNNAMEDYINILKGEQDFNAEVDKYNIELVLLPKEDNKKSLLDRFTNYFLPQEEKYSLYKYLDSNGWQIIYEDHVSTIYKRNPK